jgi:hypothetical protein
MKNVPDPLNRSRYCGDPGALVSYLYNDGTPEELAAIATHVQTCEACAIELASLGDTRELLSAWSPPQTELGLTLSAPESMPAAAAMPLPAPAFAAVSDEIPWWRQPSPVWMQAVAATMVFAAGLAIGTSSRGAATSSGTVAFTRPPSAGQPVGISRSELAALEERLRGELARLTSAASSTQAAPVQTASRADDEALLKRVRALLSESEERQRGELALRTTQVLRDMEIQRKLDIATLQNDISKIQGVTGQELLRQRELTNQLINRVGLPGGAR